MAAPKATERLALITAYLPVSGMKIATGIVALWSSLVPAAASWAEEVPVTEEIVVTGSHLRQRDAGGPAPVDVFDRAAIAETGVNTLADFARYLPYNAGVPNDAQLADTSAAGATYFNLRGMGPAATLTLVNGLRIAPYGAADAAGLSFVDLNGIPIAAIDRIEILRDGGSAIYGSDAVAGVVNIIMKERFDGVRVSAGYLGTSRGDAKEMSADVIAGHSWHRTSVMGSVSYLDRTPLAASARSYLAEPDLRAIGGHNLRSGFSSPPSVFRPLLPAVQAAPSCPGEGSGHPVAFVQTVPDHPIFDSFCRYNQRREAHAVPATTRWGMTGRLHHLLAPATKVSAEALVSHNDTHSPAAPAITDKTPIQGLRFPLVAASHPGNPYGEPLELNYRTSDVGTVSRDTESTSWRLSTSITGTRASWYWAAKVLWSESRVETVQRNLVDSVAFQSALLGTGGADGNSYYDPFAFPPRNPDDVLSFIEIPRSTRLERHRERAAELELSRRLFELPGGDADVALGYQRRAQRAVATGDTFQTSGVALGTELLRPFRGRRDIDSLYAELLLPLHTRLDVQLAARHEHYSDFGATTDPKVAFRWELLDGVTLRGSFSTSFRAPTFVELFEPVQESTRFVLDAPRCSITGAPFDCTPGPADVLTGGNPDLQPEQGQSWFAGLQWSPSAWPKLQVEFDVWHFDHEQRIVQVDPQFVLDELDGDPELVVRGAPLANDPPGTPGVLRRVNAKRLNVDRLRVQGADASMRFAIPQLAGGTLALRLQGTYLDEFVFSESAQQDRRGRDLAGGAELFPMPRLRANMTISWSDERKAVTATTHYVSGYRSPLNHVVNDVETTRAFHVDSHVTLDVQFKLTFAGMSDGTLQIGCQNCADSKPPRYNYTILGEQLHDPRGAVYYLRWAQEL